MLTLAAHSDRALAIAGARRHAVTHPGLRIVVVYELRKEPWPYRVIATDGGATPDWPDGVRQVYAAPLQLTLTPRGRRAA